jgi:hypothetical protein
MATASDTAGSWRVVVTAFLVVVSLSMQDAQLTRAWTEGGPTECSAICSVHFTEDRFGPMSVLSKKAGLKRRQLLIGQAYTAIPNGILL